MSLRSWLTWLALLSLLACGAAWVNTGDGALQRLDRAEFVISDSASPPPDSAAWQKVDLPDDWNLSRPGVTGIGWYRLRFDLDPRPGQAYALYAPRARAFAEVFLNGQPVGRTGALDRIDRASRVPQFFALPTEGLRGGSNRLDFRVHSLPYATGLATVRVGEDRLVRAEFERRWLLQITGPQVSFVLTLLFGALSLLLWWRRREELHLWFGLSMLCFAMYTTGSFIRQPPLPAPWWDTLGDLCAYAKMFFLALFALRFGQRQWPRVERVLWATMAAVACATVASYAFGSHWALDWTIDVGWRFIGVLCVAAFVSAAWDQRDAEHILVALASLVHPLVSAFFFGLTPWFHGLPWRPGFETLYPVAYDFVPMLLVIAWALTGRFVRSLDESERLNAQLERRVEEKHAELERNYQHLHRLEQQQAVVAERARIMSDMHDGIGSQLISTLSLVEHGEASKEDVAGALRECIDDLRLAIDSLEPADDDLLPVLGNLRYRLEPRLKQQGIALDWQVREMPKLVCLTPANVLHILRILQEAFTNVLKHAHASIVSVETGLDGASRAFIRVCDNGSGFDGPHKGHGIDNMKRRAQTIGARLDIRPSPAGTTLELLLPMT